jgi:acetylornithine/succinyldiaminopimelate/putrescine aminotransferase
VTAEIPIMSTAPALNPTIKAMLASLGADRTFVRGAGTRLVDAAGREYLDCWAQYGVLALGHNPPAVVAAVREALAAGTPAFLQPYRAPHAEALAEELVRRAPAGITRCLFTNSGAETVEAAIKLTRVATGRTRVLSTEGAYHGSTYAAMAAGGQPEYREGFGPLPAGFDTVPYGDADALDARLAHAGAEIAAFIVEPIQGRRGAHAPPAGYLARARAACTRHGVALIADEIQTGLGRTGTLFACERESVAPDVLLVAKALGGGLFPLGACLASDRLWTDDFALRHLSTFANNNLACLAGIVTLREIDALLPGLPEKAARLGAALGDLAARHPATVRAVRAHGLLAAIDLHQERGLHAAAVAAAIAEHEAVLVLPAVGEANVLRVIPPLIMRTAEIDLAVGGIDAVLARLERGDLG